MPVLTLSEQSHSMVHMLLLICRQGRVSQSVDKGVMVDVGAYTERGEWVDAFLHMGQIKDDGGYIAHVGHLPLCHNVPVISFHMFPRSIGAAPNHPKLENFTIETHGPICWGITS